VSFFGDLALKDPSYELYVKLARALAAREDSNPFAHYHLAAGLLRQKKDWPTAASSINKAIDGLLRGDHQFHGDETGSLGTRLIGSAFRIKATLAAEQGRLNEALAAIALAKQFDQPPVARNAEVEAEIWAKLERSEMAEAAYLEALRLGSKTAGDSLQALYVSRFGQAAGFDEYLAGKMKASSGEKKAGEQPGELSFSLTPKVAKKAAPAFTVTALDGKTYDLASLRGKVVVLNFWFTTCGGCLIEIPSLNKLAHEFKGQDVVFLALALEGKQELEPFLKKKPVDYQIIPETRAIADAYEVQGFPANIIIDREGRLQFRMSGGSADINEKLAPLIRSLLAQ
jgi:thiol-disulfide isomerase/thioredoxin